MIKTIVEEITIEECLQSLSQEKFNELFEEANEELKSKKKKITEQDKIDIIKAEIMAKYMVHCLMFTEEEEKQLVDLINGKALEKISPRILDNNFVFKIDNNYIVPTEIIEMHNYLKEQKANDKRKDMVIHFYLIVNGVLEITKLIELLKATGMTITKTELTQIAQENDFVIEDDLIYIDELAQELDKENNIHEQKKENAYKEFTIEEIFAIQLQLSLENHEEQLRKILSKKVKNKKEATRNAEIISLIATIGYDYIESIENFLEAEGIFLAEKDKDELFEIIDDIHLYYPVWEFNGYSEAEVLGIDDNEDDDEVPFEELSLDEQIDAYINIYLCLNGIIEIDKLLEILTTNHNVDITKKELIKKASSIEDMVIDGNYICIAGAEELIEEMSPVKNTLKQYKIVEDIDKEVDEFWNTGDRIAEVLLKHNIDGKISTGLFQIMQMGGIPEEMLDEILKEEGYNLSSKKIKEITKELSIIQKDVRIWCFNGFKKAELINLNKKEKIGRNDLCPCGSGKKYKKCCGR